jgi:hypothetical protein
MGSTRNARRFGWLLLACLGGVCAFGLVGSDAHARRPGVTAVAKGKAAKRAAEQAAKAEEDRRAEARKNYTDGEAKFAAGDYAAAHAAYKAANDLIPAPITLYKMALCVDKENKATEALSAYDGFLKSNPPEKMQAKVTEVQARMAELKKNTEMHLMKFVTRPSGASVAVDGVEQTGTTPLEVKLAPGSHKIRFTSGDRLRVVKELSVKASDGETIEMSL